jgi:hypothetical protein
VNDTKEIRHGAVESALFHMDAGTQALLFGVLVERVTAWTWKIAAGRERLLLASVGAIMRHACRPGKPGLDLEETPCIAP